MTKAVLHPQASVKEAASYISLYVKTEALIERLADANMEWSKSDIERAIRETGTYDFTLADIAYARKLKAEPDYQRLRTRVNLLTQSLSLIDDTEERGRFYDVEIRPLANRKIAMEEEFKKDIEGLEFYLKKEKEYV